MKMFALVGIASLCVVAGMARIVSAEMYSWTDKDGTVHFSDTPTPGAQKKQMAELFQSGRQPHLEQKNGLKVPANDLDRLLTEAEALLAQLSKASGKERRRLINAISEKTQQLGQAGLATEQDYDRIGGELGAKARKVAESLQQMGSSMSQEDMMQLLLDMRKGHVQKQGQSCEQGNSEACVEVADEHFAKDRWQEAKPLYAAACAERVKKGCLGLARVEVIEGDSSKARMLIGEWCQGDNRYSGDCIPTERSAAGLVAAAPPNMNLTYAPLPDGITDKQKLFRTLTKDAVPAARVFGEGLKHFLGIDGPVDFAQAERAFLQAQLLGIDVAQSLIEAASDLGHVPSVREVPHAAAWAKLKQTLLLKKACRLGDQRACSDFEGYPQWNQAQQSFVQGRFEQGKALLQELCGMGRISACLAVGVAEIAAGQPVRAREVHAKSCTPEQMTRNDRTKEGCRILAVRIEAVSGVTNLDQAPFPEYFKPCFYKLREHIQTTGGSDGKVIADGLLEFLGVDRPVNKKEAERLFLSVDQQWLKSSMVLTTAARQVNSCPESGRTSTGDEGITFDWKRSSLFMAACRLGDQAACREDGFKQYFYRITRDEDFIPVRTR